MIRQYLSNKNKNSTVSFKKNRTKQRQDEEGADPFTPGAPPFPKDFLFAHFVGSEFAYASSSRI